MANAVDFNDADVRRVRAALDQIEDELSDPDDLAHQYAEKVLEQAVRNASARPTPQAPMAAEGMSVQGDTIRSAGGTPGDVAQGSEFGSDIYLQFQRAHNSSGYWLFPAGESSEVKSSGDKMLEDILNRAVR